MSKRSPLRTEGGTHEYIAKLEELAERLVAQHPEHRGEWDKLYNAYRTGSEEEEEPSWPRKYEGCCS